MRYLADRRKALWQADAEAPIKAMVEKIEDEEAGKASELKSA
ncbi:MAG TPA: hypothetical protein VGK36_07460 [Candidatus Angelobacter sp.]|jgi:hypothetical protein